ncbi:MAG: Na+:solute symporter, partial [Flavobacteriales bacterium]|nr:Na+:solute symporter [Flavobacteriales bacterium]
MISNLDIGIIIVFFLITLAIGLVSMKKSGKSSAEFFLSGRNMPWWLLGVSMVATTFGADTPNLVTQIVREKGIAGNWVWWIFLLTGMFTVFIYSKLWRRSEVLTDLEFYELRYGDKAAAFLRGFRAVYLGFFVNAVIMATVCVAATKLGVIMLGIAPWKTLLIAGVVTVIYSAIGGLRGVILTDFFQFIIAMIGSLWACMIIIDLPEVGGIGQLLDHPNVQPSLEMIPNFDGGETFIMLLVFPLILQWWSTWYPGAEPGGGSYVAQRILSAKDEKNAVAATLFFNIAHYALRPWPWILIALASLIVFPELSDISNAFPEAELAMGHDIAYPAMLSKLPN